jgi:hypothetical protein
MEDSIQAALRNLEEINSGSPNLFRGWEDNTPPIFSFDRKTKQSKNNNNNYNSQNTD